MWRRDRLARGAPCPGVLPGQNQLRHKGDDRVVTATETKGGVLSRESCALPKRARRARWASQGRWSLSTWKDE